MKFLKRFKPQIYFILYYTIVITTTERYRRYLLGTWFTPSKRSKKDQLIYQVFSPVWFYYEFLKEPNPDIRVAKQGLLMGGDSGLEYAESYDSTFDPHSEHKIGNLVFTKACPAFHELDLYLSESKDKKRLLIQIGMSSGKEIAWYAQKYPDIDCIGFDLFRNVEERAQKKYGRKNLFFLTLPAHQIDTLCRGKENIDEILILSSGSLQYVQPEHLLEMFLSISKINISTRLYLIEPTNTLYGDSSFLPESRYRGNFSFSHDYEAYAKKAHLKTIKSELIHPFEPQSDFYPHHQGTAHYFYIGSTLV